ncbi:DNA modification system-associated small protein [Candidatus Enterococcus murrayae]|uniref:Uncharacterized protein n=1 Tax=Candidatus Enterococcus murrayae TaxID=2815321 RepID=A0ABS3HNP7_9ENTE|nr:DNA modification system-associated small protein [Enterococcus sp. MJM16]MBO0455081.1 hypothetical protein [Enterococcus sp. MJM16]
MNKESNNLDEIKQALEKIRSEKYPNISSELFDSIVDIQFEYLESDSRSKGRERTKKIIKEYIENDIEGATEC